MTKPHPPPPSSHPSPPPAPNPPAARVPPAPQRRLTALAIALIQRPTPRRLAEYLTLRRRRPL